MIKLKPGKPADVGLSPSRIARVEELCSSWVSAGITPALSVLAARKGTIFLHKAWGKLSPEPGSAPMTTDSAMGMASCSKPVTATAVMILVEEGMIGLQHPLQEYLPEFEGPDAALITIRHLLTHTSGLPERSPGETIQGAEEGLKFPPGRELAYSNVGYDLLGMVVEKVSGMPFEVFTSQRIFEPLGMKDTTFVHRGLDRDHSVLPRPGTSYDWPAEMEGTVSGSSTMWSTSLDMGIFLQSFLNGGSYGDFQLLSRSAVDAMTRNQVRGLPRELIDGVTNQPQGLGWFLLDGIQFPHMPCLFSSTSYGHSGASGAMIWVDPTYELVGAFLFTKIREQDRPLDHFVDSLMGCIVD